MSHVMYQTMKKLKIMKKSRDVVVQLKPYHEIIGVLHAVSEEDSCCRLQFSCNYDIDLPTSAIAEKKVAEMIGKKVGIFNCDGEFFVRIISER